MKGERVVSATSVATTTSTTTATAAFPMLGRGVVRHKRLRPAVNAFDYATYFFMLPLRSLRADASKADTNGHQTDDTSVDTNVDTNIETDADGLVRNRWGWLSFHDADHGDGRSDALAWLDELLVSQGIQDALGEAWLHTYPRVLGYAFKPVSFWYCHRLDGSLAALVVEVNNTFGERHCYLLCGPQLAWGRELKAHKVFHVSPFCSVQGQYRFRFMRTDTRVVARVDHDDDQGALLQTSISGQLTPLTRSAVRRAFFGTPLMTLTVVARIHWQALRLWLKRVPFFRKPAPPQAFISR